MKFKKRDKVKVREKAGKSILEVELCVFTDPDDQPMVERPHEIKTSREQELSSNNSAVTTNTSVCPI